MDITTRWPDSWQTFEAPFNAHEVIRAAAREHDLILFDCITIYLSNLLCALPEAALDDQDQVCTQVRDQIAALIGAHIIKIKLSTAIIGISSIHLLKTFINAANIAEHTIMWQVIIHVVFLVSALAMAMVDKMMNQTVLLSKH
mgnify:CR=1 FL=1